MIAALLKARRIARAYGLMFGRTRQELVLEAAYALGACTVLAVNLVLVAAMEGGR